MLNKLLPTKLSKIAAAVLLVLLLTNPSKSDFKSFLHTDNDDSTGRKVNLFILSIYSYRYHGYSTNLENHYLGVLGNFVQLNDDAAKYRERQ